MRTDRQAGRTRACITAAAGMALAITGVSAPVTGQEDVGNLCPNAPFYDCEPVATTPQTDTPVIADLDRWATARPGYTQTGKASWYGSDFHGRKTASGERFNQHALTAAHRTLPLGTEVRVTNLESGRTVLVQINDRGPYIDGRIIDLSKRAASVLGMEEAGVVPVKVETVTGERPTEKAAAGRGKARDVEVAEQPDQR